MIEPSAEAVSIISTVLVGLWVGIRKISKQLEHNLSPNGGNSLRDAIDKIHCTVLGVEAQMRAHLDLESKGYYITDRTGKCKWVSRGWTKLTGIDIHDAEGEGWVKGIHVEDRSRVYGEWRVFAGTQTEFSLEYRTALGECVRGESVPLRDQDKNVIGYIGSIRRMDCP